MTDQEREFEKIATKLFGSLSTEMKYYDQDINKIIKTLNEAYAKGRQSILDNFPDYADFSTRFYQIKEPAPCRPVYDWILSKLSDDKGG